LHLIWFDNVFILAESDRMAQTILGDVTEALWGNLGMSWKPKSLELLRSDTWGGRTKIRAWIADEHAGKRSRRLAR